MKAVGTRCGPEADGLLAIDLDGESAINECNRRGCSVTTDTWRIGRTTATDRLKLMFRLPPDLQQKLGKRKVRVKTGEGEQIEMFWSSGQVIVLGEHHSSGGFYTWEGEPSDTQLLSEDSPWWRFILERLGTSPGQEQDRPAARHQQKRSTGGAVCLKSLLNRELERAWDEGVGEGTRNDIAFNIAVGLLTAEAAARDAGLQVEGEPEELLLVFAARCTPPISEAEARTCFRSAQSQPRNPDPGLRKRIEYHLRSQRRDAESASDGGNPPPPHPPGDQEQHPEAKESDEQHPVRGNGRPKRLLPHEVLDLLPKVLGATPRLNVRSHQVHLDTTVLTGDDVGRLYVRLSNSEHVWPKETTADAVMLLATQNQFDPVADYLNTTADNVEPLPLEVWQRLDQHLLGLEDPIAAEFLPLFLIAAVARTFEPGCSVRRSLVLVGPQERGKTTLGRILFGEDHWVEGIQGTNDRDMRTRCHTAWGVELAELNGITRTRDQEHLKAFLTERVDVLRRAYGKGDERYPRRFVFWGTSNGPPLRDLTGSTRFVCIHISDQPLPFDWLIKHRDAIWSRAVERYRAGVQWDRITEEQRQALEERNADHREIDPWAETIEAHLNWSRQIGNLPVTIPALLDRLEVPTERQSNAAAARVRGIAENLGWVVDRRRDNLSGGVRRKGLWPKDPPATQSAPTGTPPGHTGPHRGRPGCGRAEPSGDGGSCGAGHSGHTDSVKTEKDKAGESEQAAAGVPSREEKARDRASGVAGVATARDSSQEGRSQRSAGVSPLWPGSSHGVASAATGCSVDLADGPEYESPDRLADTVRERRIRSNPAAAEQRDADRILEEQHCRRKEPDPFWDPPAPSCGEGEGACKTSPSDGLEDPVHWGRAETSPAGRAGSTPAWRGRLAELMQQRPNDLPVQYANTLASEGFSPIPSVEAIKREIERLKNSQSGSPPAGRADHSSPTTIPDPWHDVEEWET